ncbi:MAG: SCO family protein [Bacteroidales bacterium]|nr:SCO family protein [Bacteroidales bacterium]
MKITGCIAFLILFTGIFAQAPVGQYTPEEGEIGIFERLDTYLPEDITIIDHLGAPHNILDLIDKPTVIALVYYRCPGICSPFMNAMADVINSSNLEIGKDYQILNISFDAREGVDLAKSNRNNYHNLIKKDFDEEGWKFFVADSADIAKLTTAVGFKYKRTGLDFAHTSAMIFVSKSEKITRYLHGTYFLPIDLKMAVIETAEERSGPSMSRLLSYCYAYDTEGQRYVMNITKVAGTIILFFTALIFLFLIIKPRKKTQSN